MEYISHVDYKGMMEAFKKGAPKKMLKEGLEQEGNAFTAGLAKAKKGEEFKVDGKAVKDTSNYDSSMEESHLGMDKWYEDFENGLQNLVKNGYMHKNQYQYFRDALDHVDPMQNYGHMPAHDAAKEFVDDLRTKDAIDQDKEQFNREGGFEEEVKKLQEIAGVGPQDDGPEDDNTEAREKRAHREEEETEEAENAERDLDEGEMPAKVLGHVKGDVYKIRTPKGEVIELDFDAERGDKIDDYVYEGSLEAEDDDYVYYLPAAFVVTGGGSFSVEPYYEEFYAIPHKRASKEGLNEGAGYEDPATLARAVALAHPELQKFALEDRKMFQRAALKYAFEMMIKSGVSKVATGNLVSGVADEDWPSDYISALGEELEGMQEGLHMPPLQATGQTITANENAITNPGMGFGVLSPDERNQLVEYINHYKTIKSEISKLLSKAGKSGKIMEGREEDENVPAERPAHYNEPTKTPKHKSSNLGGDRTNLVMTKAEMWEGSEEHEHETIEDSLGEKLHDTFHKVTDMAIKQLVADGWDPSQAASFLKVEIEERAKEATNAQYDL